MAEIYFEIYYYRLKDHKLRDKIKKILYKAIGKCRIKTPRRALGSRVRFLTVRRRWEWIILSSIKKFLWQQVLTVCPILDFFKVVSNLICIPILPISAFCWPPSYIQRNIQIWYCSYESSSGNTIYLSEFILLNMMPSMKTQSETNAF